MSKINEQINEENIEEDFLEVDQPIPGQNYTCISFISPEKIIKQKEVFFMKKFLQDLLTDAKKREYLINMNVENLSYEKVNDMVEDFRLVNEKKINNEFDELVDFRTNIRGIKSRGNYDTLKEARVRAKILQRKDPKFNVFVAQVGYWLPWDPSTTDEIEAEYQEKQLNQLMKNYKINAEHRDIFYQEEKQHKLEEAKKENAKRIKENIEKGNIKEENIPKENVEEKLTELRNVLDEKDSKFNQVLKESHVFGGGSEKAAIVSDDNNETNDPLGNNSGYADPWLKRKSEGITEIPLPSDTTEVILHDADNVTAQEDNNLDKVVKGIF